MLDFHMKPSESTVYQLGQDAQHAGIMETGLEKTSVMESFQLGLSATVPHAFQFNVALRLRKPLGLLWKGSPGRLPRLSHSP